MFKIYRNLKIKDWLLVVLIAGITVAQVFFTMQLTDQVSAIVGAIQAVSLGAASTAQIWKEGGIMLAYAMCSALCQVATGVSASKVASDLSAGLMQKWRAFQLPK